MIYILIILQSMTKRPWCCTLFTKEKKNGQIRAKKWEVKKGTMWIPSPSYTPVKENIKAK